MAKYVQLIFSHEKNDSSAESELMKTYDKQNGKKIVVALLFLQLHCSKLQGE
jgi:hypothetical protein